MSDENPSGDQQQSDLHVDADWKAQAQAEKEKLEQELKEKEGQQGEQSGQEMPPADFKTLVSTMASQALLYMGAIPDPSTGQRIAHLQLAQHHIDMLGVLQEKTQGNLDEEEQKLIDQTTNELKQYYVQVQGQVAQQQAEQAQQGGQQPGGQQSGGGPGSSGGSSGGIITPGS